MEAPRQPEVGLAHLRLRGLARNPEHLEVRAVEPVVGLQDLQAVRLDGSQSRCREGTARRERGGAELARRRPHLGRRRLVGVRLIGRLAELAQRGPHLGRGGLVGRRPIRRRWLHRRPALRLVAEVLQHTRREQAEQAALHVIGRQRRQPDDFPRVEPAVDAGQDVSVDRTQADSLVAQQGVGRDHQDAIDVPEVVAHDVGVPDPARRLEDQLAGREPERDVGVEDLVQGLVHELVGAVGPGEELSQHLVGVGGDRRFERSGVQEPRVQQHRPQPPAVPGHGFQGALEVRPREPALPHEHLAEPVSVDARLGAQDVALAEAKGAPIVAAHEGQHPRSASHVQLPKDSGKDPLPDLASHSLHRPHDTRPSPRGHLRGRPLAPLRAPSARSAGRRRCRRDRRCRPPARAPSPAPPGGGRGR
jgi:hypothetical protein